MANRNIEMLKKAIVLIGLAMSLAASAAGQRSDDRTAVLAVVKQLFAEMAAANPEIGRAHV